MFFTESGIIDKNYSKKPIPSLLIGIEKKVMDIYEIYFQIKKIYAN